MTDKPDLTPNISELTDHIREATHGKRAILIYPFSFPASGNTFLSAFLHQPDTGFLYYRIPAEQTTLELFLAGMVREFRAVVSDQFGRNLGTALERATSSADLGVALAEDLNAHAAANGRSVILYIDELDRLPLARDFEAFATSLVDELGRRVQVAFNSRMLRQQPWLELVRAGKAVVLGAEQRKEGIEFVVEEAIKPQVEIYGFGRGHVVVNGRPISNWDGALPRNLFFFFVDRPLVTRSEIFDTFWGDLNVKEATNVFHVTKRKIAERISSQIEDGKNYELTQYMSGYYLPSDKIIRHYDVAEFVDAVTQAEATDNPHEKAILYGRAIDLYRAPFLQTLEMEWIQERRAALKDMFARSLIEMGRISETGEQWERAIGYYARALREVPERDDVHIALVEIYLRLGMNEDAALHLDQLAKERGGVETNKDFKRLLAKIK